jgi:hypothetical protein
MQMKLLTQADLAVGGVPLHGPWPLPGLRTIPIADLEVAVHGEIIGYWHRLSRKLMPWLHDSWVDHGLIVLPRPEALLTAGDLITKSEAISRLAGFGVPASLIQEIRGRRDGLFVTMGRRRHLSRALLTRHIMQDVIVRLAQFVPPSSQVN